MIKTAPQGWNSVNGRENTLRLLLRFELRNGRMAQEVGVQVQIPAGLLAFFFAFFFPFIVFLPFGLFPFILIADPF